MGQVQTSEYSSLTRLYECSDRQTSVLLTCTCSYTVALRGIIVGVAPATSIDKRCTASCLAVVVPAIEGCSAGAHNRLSSTAF